MAFPAPDFLQRTLAQVFGFPAFRPGQEAVCHAVSHGQDVLVVMPTGSGKSLCYQLPALALGGTALVISPLIALMEDQVSKLSANRLRADRIHSGRDRQSSRAAALAYRDGSLQFLFIAPERLSIPGFPEFLAKRKPCLVAVDEAHCISQWGHDFRPDYRMLRRYLPMLRPAPIIALTATATPVVQNDIVGQLALDNPLRSIQGFRRKNIAIEVIQIPPAVRPRAVQEVLVESGHRPAIIYVPTRKHSDSLAADLSHNFRAAPYHAGLPSPSRQQVQQQFLAGDLEVIVATIAFGMGIDKPDIRTVIHTALPGSVESYYQEIGRAGRDGAPSRAILFHSYADRHRHDFFLNRDYPEVETVDTVFALLQNEPVAKEALQKTSRLLPEVFDSALEKLWVHGGALVDPEENVTRGHDRWRESYLSQTAQRAAQVELMLRYASADGCRMAALVRYFGDRSDTQSSCGLCDFCAPHQCLVQRFRDPTPTENRIALRVLDVLEDCFPRSTGKLFSEMCGNDELDRDSFEELLASLSRAGLIYLQSAVFEKEGKQIRYRTARRISEGELATEPLQLQLREKRDYAGRKSARKKPQSGPKQKPAGEPNPTSEPLLQALREWRLKEAKSKVIPAFCVSSDQVLRSIVDDRPLTEDDLLAISGIGPAKAKQYGPDILKIVSAFEQLSG